MADMLVRLYDLPDASPALEALRPRQIAVRRPEVWERALLVDWVAEQFSAGWSLECEAAFRQQPASCFIATQAGRLIGFACHDCTRPNFFGPTGVALDARGQGVGTGLLRACLQAMRDAGFAYAIIGGVGPADFYARAVGAMTITGSSPGVYDFGLVKAG